MNDSFVPKDLTSRDFIIWLFRERCVICNEDGTEVNEIEPRSKSKKSIQNWKNKVLMCRKHHREYHDNGTSGEAIEKLKERRVEFLVGIGREIYA